MRPSLRAGLALILFVLCSAVLWQPAAQAQTVGQNVNMVSGTKWPTGDPFLQRQNEPSMAVSTRNPMHILAGANDYRTVDLETLLSGGTETGDSWLGLFKSFDGGYTWQSTLLPGCPEIVPQCTDNNGTGNTALQGIYGAASDPVVRAGTNGMFYYAGLAFVRPASGALPGTASSIFVARYNDLNNDENIDPIAYIDTRTIATGSGSQFLDKPALAVDIPRAGANTCSFAVNEPGVVDKNGNPISVNQSFAAGNVYVAYTEFLKATKDNSTPTQLMFSHSTDCGVTWSTPVQLNKGTVTSQGAAIAVNALNGNVYVTWRQFASTGVSNAIMVAQSTNAGKSFSTPVQISTFTPFDQATTGTSFRTNAYPSITTDNFGFVYVAFSAKGVGPGGDARVVAAGSIDGTHWTPAIMVDNPKQSATNNPSGRGHQIMPAITFANGRLTILYYDLRFDHYVNFYSPASTNGTYIATPVAEGELAAPANPSEVFTPFIDDYGLTVRRHTIDLRVLELGILPTVTLGPSVSVSQYAFGCCVPPGTVQQSPTTIEQYKFNVPNLPLFAEGAEPFMGDYIEVVPSPLFVPNGSGWAYNFKPSVNPLFHATWTDNRDVVPPPDGDWTHYTPPIIAGTTGPQMSIFEPGQTLLPCNAGHEGMRNQNIYTALITGGLVVGAPGNAKPLGTTTFTNPTTGVTSTVPFQRAFAVEAQNITGQQIFVRFTISNQPAGGTASFLQFSQLTTLDVTVPSYSSVSRSVFVTSTNPLASVTVNVAQISAIGGSVVSNGLSGTAVLNPDATNPNIQNPNIQNPNIQNPNIQNTEVTDPNIGNADPSSPNIQNPNIQNPDIQNPNIQNPNIQNPNIQNPNIQNVSATSPNIQNGNIQNPNIQNPDTVNPNIQNPNIQNPNIQNNTLTDVIYPMTNNGNTTATYTVQIATASNNSVPAGIVVQLILNKLYQTPMAENCQLGVETHWVTVANIINPKLYTPGTAGLGTPNIQNAVPNEASVTLAPGETVYIDLRIQNPEQTPAQQQFNPVTTVVPVTVPQAVNTQTVLSNPGNPNLTGPVVYPQLTITTPSLPATDRFDPNYSVQLAATGGKPGADSWSWSAPPATGLPPGLQLSTSGLLTGTANTPGSYPVTVMVADSAMPPNTSSKNFTLNVSVTPLTLQFVLTPPDGVVGQQYTATPLAVNGGTPPYVWTATGLPAGLSINASTGQISGIPTTPVPGGTSVQIAATDAAFPAESIPYTPIIRIGSVIQISPATLPSGTIGTPYSFQLSASGGIGSVGFLQGTLPGGGTIDSTGLINFANPQSSTVSFSVSAHDGANPFQFATANYTITFAGAPSVNILYITQPPNYVQGQVNPNFPVHIHVQDNQGAAIAGANVTMSFNGTPPCAAAVLSDNAETLTQATSATGDVFFTFMNINRGGVGYRLNATVGALSAASNLFDVVGYCETGNMNTARRNHIQLTLPNGKVLITGGATNANATGVTTSAELYDPVAHTFTTISPMNVARADHTLTLLPNGKVLVVGGFNDNVSSLASAEVFDPSNNTFTSVTAPLTSPRAQHAAALLPNGTVLVTGGNDNSGNALASAEIFDPNGNGGAGTFTATTHAMNSVRQIHHSDLLPNGLVLISGGLDTTNNALNSAELYDSNAGTFTLTGSMTTGRGNHGTALLYNGKLLVQGGLSGPGTSLALTATAELYDPIAGTFSTTGSLTQPRGQYYDEILADGTVFVTGGASLPGGANSDIFDPVAGTFSATPNYTASQTGLRPALLPDGTVLLSSGVNSTPATVPNSEVYIPLPAANGITVTSPSPLPQAVVGIPYATVLLQKGGVGIVTWAPVSLPTGLTLSAGGILAGTPTAPGSFDVVFTVTDTNAPPQSITTTLLLTIDAPLSISTTTLPQVGTTNGAPAGLPPHPYAAQISTTGGLPGPLQFSIISGALPSTISLNPTSGALTSSGVTDATGTYNFTVKAVSGGQYPTTATQALSITIVPFFYGTTSNTLVSGTENTPYSTTVSSAGGVTPYIYTVISGNTPNGTSLTTGTPNATISGTPTLSGIFTFIVSASDSTAPPQGYTEQLTITIKPQPPTGLIASPQGAPGTGIVTLTWTLSNSGDVAGYKVYYGTSSGNYTNTVSAGSTNSFVFPNGQLTSGQHYFFAVSAVSAAGVESVVSNEANTIAP